MAWPPTLADLKEDRGIALDDVRDDTKLTIVLNAAVSFVERVRPGFQYVIDPLSEFPLPTADLELGTIRLAYRWHERRKSPDALIEMAELGAARIPAFDPDIERMLGIGRFRGPMFA